MPYSLQVCLIVVLVLLPSSLLNPGGSSYAQSAAGTRTQSSRPTPEKAQPSPAKPADYSKEAVVIEHLKSLYRFEKDGTGQREMTLRVKIQSEAGMERFGQLIFSYSSANEKLEVDFIRVLKADGTAVSASAANVQDLSAPIAREAPVYTDARQKHVTVPGLRPGDVLEYHIVWQVHTPVAANHFWVQHNFVSSALIVLNEELEVNVPQDSRPKLKTESGLDPAITDQDGRRVYRWKHANLKRDDKKDEEKEKKDEDEEPKPPQIQMTTFQSWDEVGQWYAALERDRSVPDDKVRARTEELVRGLKSDEEKIEALYQFVAKNFRYVSLSLGQGRYQPHAAADVLANQYGDCKDKHTLLSAMLVAAGLRAYPALMNSSQKIDPDMPSPAQFDHVISAIPRGAETLWADTTAEVAPFRLLSPQLRDKKALVIPTTGPARLETTPAEPPFLSSELIEVAGQVNDLGKLSAHSRATLRGDAEMVFRMMFLKTPRSEWKELRYYFTMLGALHGEVSEIKPSDPAALERPFEVEFDVSNDEFLDWSSKKVKVALPLPSFNLNTSNADKPGRSKPIQLGPPARIVYQLKLTLPSKYQGRAPLPLTVNRDYATYSSTYKLEGTTLTAERVLLVRQREIPASRAQDYLAFVAAARADEAQTLSLETSLAGSPTIPDSVKTEELIQAAEAAAGNQNYQLVEELLKRVLEKEPAHQRVRRQLGWALFAQNKADDAIVVLREQTKINPFDDYSHNLLGQIYWRQQKYAEAESAFRKQIEITPLGKSAQANLGQMLVEWRKYKEAVPELEKAISLNPEGEMLHVSLGRAYLNLGEIQKASESFDQAVKLAPEPPVWNDVAYFMSEKKVQLDKAQQYAESAVAAVATALRNVELERLTMREVVLVNSIAAYWDTLGWVYFQKGNLDMAEKYISAAWTLAGHSEVGYHLGQIEEKRGRNEAAIRMYGLAALGSRPIPELQESLDRLVPKDKIKALLEKASTEQMNSRTLKLGTVKQNVKGTTEAQFFVVLAPGPSRNAVVTEVRFIRGDEKLRPLSATLKEANFNFVFPDEIPTRITRRGTLFCHNGVECSFIMMSPDNVFSVD
jgi:tetratricopeptide (TPR) repeat protein